jgi:hypothetical protein
MRRALALLIVCGTAAAARGDERPRHRLPPAQHGGTVVGMCDGQTSVEADVPPGTKLTRAQAQAVSDRLMAAWRKKHPGATWDDAVAQNTTPAPGVGHGAGTSKRNAPPKAAPTTVTPSPVQPKPPTSTGAPPSTRPHVQRGTYTTFDARDELVWQSETQKFVDEGNRIFHDAKALGSTVGISCDMCHPNAANTHPETYPKYQVQLQRVALLRDMINWCLENPVKAEALPDDSPKLRALEAYILAQRKGQKLDYGRH